MGAKSKSVSDNPRETTTEFKPEENEHTQLWKPRKENEGGGGQASMLPRNQIGPHLRSKINNM